MFGGGPEGRWSLGKAFLRLDIVESGSPGTGMGGVRLEDVAAAGMGVDEGMGVAAGGVW